MGRLQAEEFASMDIDLRTALSWHLRANHYPPYPVEMIDTAISAIDACNEGNCEKIIETSIEHMQYGKRVPAFVIIKSLHLSPWVDYEHENK